MLTLEEMRRKMREEYAEWLLPEERAAEHAVRHGPGDSITVGTRQTGKQAEALTKPAPSLAETEHAAEAQTAHDCEIQREQSGRKDRTKPVNFIPRDGLLARCVRMLAAESHSQARIARELRLNKRTVSRLLQREAD